MFQSIANFFGNAWGFIALHAKNVWAAIAAAIIAILSFFGIKGGDCLQPDRTTTTTTAIVTTTTTAATTTTTEVTTKAPAQFTITPAQIEALNLDDITREVKTINSFGNPKYYSAVGPVLKDVLEALGADMSAINSGSTLTASCTDPDDSASATIDSYMILNDDTVLALTVGGSTADAPRLFAADEPGEDFTDSTKCVKMVDTLILNYN